MFFSPSADLLSVPEYVSFRPVQLVVTLVILEKMVALNLKMCDLICDLSPFNCLTESGLKSASSSFPAPVLVLRRKLILPPGPLFLLGLRACQTYVIQEIPLLGPSGVTIATGTRTCHCRSRSYSLLCTCSLACSPRSLFLCIVWSPLLSWWEGLVWLADVFLMFFFSFFLCIHVLSGFDQGETCSRRITQCTLETVQSNLMLGDCLRLWYLII